MFSWEGRWSKSLAFSLALGYFHECAAFESGATFVVRQHATRPSTTLYLQWPRVRASNRNQAEASITANDLNVRSRQFSTQQDEAHEEVSKEFLEPEQVMRNVSSVAPVGTPSDESQAHTFSDHSDSKGKKLRTRLQKVRNLTKSIVMTPLRPPPPPMPQAIAALIRDAAQQAVETTMEEVILPSIRERQEAARAAQLSADLEAEGHDENLEHLDLANVVKVAEAAVEDSIAIQSMRAQLVVVEGLASGMTQLAGEMGRAAGLARMQAEKAIKAAEDAEVLANRTAETALLLQDSLSKILVSSQNLAAQELATQVAANPHLSANGTRLVSPAGTESAEAATSPGAATSEKKQKSARSSEVDFSVTEMAPPFLDESSCLVPGEAVIRVEKAPDNSRRIFAGIDILASVDDVWKILTDYENLDKVVPNLVTNKVLTSYNGNPHVNVEALLEDASLTPQEQCRALADTMKGARLFQVGGAKVVGINFSAKTTLDVREWPEGLPDFAHFGDEKYSYQSKEKRAKDGPKLPLERYNFPRPFAICSLPHKDISMQSVENDNGEFRMYQGVWRMQPLPGCAPPGCDAMRLTYAVEISPRSYLPVRLVEGRIAQDLCANLKAIRGYVTGE